MHWILEEEKLTVVGVRHSFANAMAFASGVYAVSWNEHAGQAQFYATHPSAEGVALATRRKGN
ncbi:uncharacterized protein ColSpa_02032 [Colletotrichum spaethianum]|uniref:Uncharacterized protein n=1 Tax=Colletotrichum spaethianum TaxID=700344 RepID=A0AA37L503_9PEZI|nr:uncharacterized protein ColSpa_02032 [Colletotrichum spaethianum]GKT41851.1 hypothetical protein ColSpa_02032 [Colletotrichum spaethianum]